MAKISRKTLVINKNTPFIVSDEKGDEDILILLKEELAELARFLRAVRRFVDSFVEFTGKCHLKLRGLF